MTAALREEPNLPAEFPLPRPVDIRTAVIDRDGSTCRMCGDRVECEEATMVNVRPGLTAGELAELQIVLGCDECRRATVYAATGPTTPKARRIIRLMHFLYLENCQIAQLTPLRAVRA